ncbi:hypothetical protein [Marinimicrobium sp. ABcell2]|uniref:hypothetical protein n=1 Tax=Marinimicrobium sp. ABcell2 TaxID=3069751 RepID=UPI0027B26F22|nr:hypothetical protein [Marinimicrobium sp. ABcell2]MDQ2075247.1 hypothetical protein [Marinimicrobium sp. ABcell2]
MADIHIADFYKDAARTLIQLFNQFPRPIMLFVEDIAGPDTPDEFGLHSPRHQACFATMLWLEKSGYIRYESLVRQEALDQATLTQRGFTLLASRLPIAEIPGMTPPGQDQDNGDLPGPEVATQTNGAHLLRQVLQHGSSSAIEQVMLELLRQARHHV